MEGNVDLNLEPLDSIPINSPTQAMNRSVTRSHLNGKNNSNHRPRPSLFQQFNQIADNSGHILEILHAAMPYIDSRRQGTIETLAKATDFIHSARNSHQPTAELSAASIQSRPTDVECMLNSIRTVGSFSERDLIDKMLNYFKAKKLYQTYSLFNQNKDILKATGSGPSSNGNYGNNTNFMEAFKNILPKEQAANLDNAWNVFNAMNAMNAMNSNPNMNTPNYNPTNSFMNVKKEADAQQQTVSTQNVSKVPNYTYQMEKANHSMPQEKTQSITPQSGKNTTSNTNMSDPNTWNQIYNNMNAIYQALNQAGLNQNQTSSMNQANANTQSQNNMMNTLAMLANSGLFNSNSNTSQPQNNANQMTHYPIPNANSYQSDSTVSIAELPQSKPQDQTTIKPPFDNMPKYIETPPNSSPSNPLTLAESGATNMNSFETSSLI